MFECAHDSLISKVEVCTGMKSKTWCGLSMSEAQVSQTRTRALQLCLCIRLCGVRTRHSQAEARGGRGLVLELAAHRATPRLVTLAHACCRAHPVEAAVQVRRARQRGACHKHEQQMARNRHLEKACHVPSRTPFLNRCLLPCAGTPVEVGESTGETCKVLGLRLRTA